ncbi:MAG: acyl-CoA dehydrogenase family protein [Acidobacteria bacterium]|nr:acyl-CoA dehydrogenase family protein [Acidobacteriota bacterium]
MAHLKDFRGVEGTDFFEQDRGFQSLLADLLNDEDRPAVFASLHDCARLAAGRWHELACAASRHENLPKIIKVDRAGNAVEQIDFGAYTPQLRREAAEFGLFTKAGNELHKFAMIYYSAHNGEAAINCGVSCTDGLIRSIEAKGSEFLREFYLSKLLSTKTPFAGAQFVTERTGGSDVGAIAAQATRDAEGNWTITGEKWFCSNPDEYYLVAAKFDNQAQGTAGVATFLVPRVLPDGRLNRVSFTRLKDKLGTRSLPTAEMDFNGATAFPIGELHEGFKTLMNYVINASRIHNAVNACAFTHRAFLEARNYARQREAFGQTLLAAPLIQESLLLLLERAWRHRVLTFRLIAMVDENGLAPEDAETAMWQRFLINLAKYRTAVQLVDSMREAMLILGGNGIIEDFTILPRLFRDAMIIETWEGPPNTLCLQIMRDAAKSNLLQRFQAEIHQALALWPTDFLSHTRRNIEHEFKIWNEAIAVNAANMNWLIANARRVVDRMGGVVEICWLVEMALRHQERDATAALMASLAAKNLFAKDDFHHPAQALLAQYGLALIEEEEIKLENFSEG